MARTCISPTLCGARFCEVRIRMRASTGSTRLKAWQVPGVKAIVTGKDEPEHYQGKSIRDIPVLCWDKVRYIGDKVAAVAAESRDAAEEAINLIDVEYEELPAVFDVIEAMKPGAPVLHDNAPAYDGAPKEIMAAAGGNVVNKLTFGKGDIEKGFRRSRPGIGTHFSHADPSSRLSRAAVVSRQDRGRRQGQCLGLDQRSFRHTRPICQGGRHSGEPDSCSSGPRRRRLRRQERRGRVADLLLSCQAGEAAGEDCFDSHRRIDRDESGSLHGGQGENRRQARRADDRALFASDPRHRRLRRHETRSRQHRRRRLGNTVQDRQQLYGSVAGLYQHSALRFLARAGRDPGGVRF